MEVEVIRYDYRDFFAGELKPCPFCGGEARFECNEQIYNGVDYKRVSRHGEITCLNCCCQMAHSYIQADPNSIGKFIEILIASWNKRQGRPDTDMGASTVKESIDRGGGETLDSMPEIVCAAADALKKYGGTITAFKTVPNKKCLKLTVSFDVYEKDYKQFEPLPDSRLWMLASTPVFPDF